MKINLIYFYGKVVKLNNECLWLPPLKRCEDLNKYAEYEDELYEIFKRDFINNQIYFESKVLRIRKHPITYGREEAFYHIICKDLLKNRDRTPDIARCERIEWPRKIIDNCKCDNNCIWCSKIKIYKKIFKNNNYRYHILFEEYSYIVIVEERKEYMLFITGYVIDEDNEMDKKLKDFGNYKIT
ncbi:MAG: hypothetical protein A2Y24_07540 [Clostridiales bacterium GWE2_32_10]|nr:MAG: hypothetical protein A2Y24_07540 [Clostridiales bacterium GWE2_32_10]HBY21611.1 hypothetical protein [Clostridiales bacterium]